MEVSQELIFLQSHSLTVDLTLSGLRYPKGDRELDSYSLSMSMNEGRECERYVIIS